MTGAARVARLLLYPVKSLYGQEVESAAVLPNGALEHDRAFALFDDDGKVINAKRFAVLQTLRSRLDLERRVLLISDKRFDLDTGRFALQDHLRAVLGFGVTLAEDRGGGFPDDRAAPGPTLIATATLEAIAGWFRLPVGDVRARLRTNIEIDGVPPFWEDRLFGPGDAAVAFSIGGIRFAGTNPCLRCAVPTRDPWSGVADRGFAKRFAALREAHLPPWAAHDRFKPFYRVAVNTRRHGDTPRGSIRSGDLVRIE